VKKDTADLEMAKATIATEHGHFAVAHPDLQEVASGEQLLLSSNTTTCTQYAFKQ